MNVSTAFSLSRRTANWNINQTTVIFHTFKHCNPASRPSNCVRICRDIFSNQLPHFNIICTSAFQHRAPGCNSANCETRIFYFVIKLVWFISPSFGRDPLLSFFLTKARGELAFFAVAADTPTAYLNEEKLVGNRSIENSKKQDSEQQQQARISGG